jgi:hypothetical protein
MSAARPFNARQAAAVAARWYVVLLAVCVMLRLAASLYGGSVWFVGAMPWEEIFYGPAIAAAVMFVAPWTAAKVEGWLKARRAAVNK